MPRVRQLTPALRREEAERVQRERVIRIINAAAAAAGYDRHTLATAAEIEYHTLNNRLRGASEFRMPELCRIATALRFDATTCAAVCGAKQKCRYETGFRVNEAVQSAERNM